MSRGVERESEEEEEEAYLKRDSKLLILIAPFWRQTFKSKTEEVELRR
jgi:hypothetical protein